MSADVALGSAPLLHPTIAAFATKAHDSHHPNETPFTLQIQQGPCHDDVVNSV